VLTAVFVLIVAGLLGAAMVRLLRSGELAIALEVVSVRALHAAESGAQRKLNEVLLGSGPAACAGVDSWTWPASTVLDGCSATVDCRSFVTGTGETFIELSSTGQCGAGEQLASRTVDVQVRL
jgi:MSHA biogenesis protein MshP